MRELITGGNELVALAAIESGCRFFGGYPITPSSEIAHEMSVELPKIGGKFIQMEDEISGIAVALGASMTGVKAMTATSGPGISLKSEQIGYGFMAEIPLVVVDVMRGGPSTGFLHASHKAILIKLNHLLTGIFAPLHFVLGIARSLHTNYPCFQSCGKIYDTCFLTP